MSKKSERENKASELKDELNSIINDNSKFNVGDFLAKPELLPELGDIQIFDYDEEVLQCNEKAKEVMTSLAELYLGDAPSLLEQNYIKVKLEEDTMIYAEAMFLQRMSKKNYINQLKQIDNGDNNTRMHEVVNRTSSEIRENIKFALNIKSQFEDFYKKIREDLGMEEISEKNQVLDEIKSTHIESEENDSENNGSSMIFDQRNINDMIQNILTKNKEDDESSEDLK